MPKSAPNPADPWWKQISVNDVAKSSKFVDHQIEAPDMEMCDEFVKSLALLVLFKDDEFIAALIKEMEKKTSELCGSKSIDKLWAWESGLVILIHGMTKSIARLPESSATVMRNAADVLGSQITHCRQRVLSISRGGKSPITIKKRKA
jgi:hypothetical protein